ncbi:MAG: hypothetical protein KGL39_48165 [Patescibacteria group bacterium]|nr:hypothetical protein [Patescibacteria group bacterium]
MSERMSDERLREILDGCEGVTPGPWKMQEIDTEGDEVGEAFIVGARQQGLIGVALPFPREIAYCDFSRVAANGRHFARLDPHTVRSMVSELLDRRAANAGTAEPVAWLGYWPGAGSIDSRTAVSRFKRDADRWRKSGAEVTELYAPDALATAREAGRREGLEEAERWRALMSSGRLHFMGCAGFDFSNSVEGSRAMATATATPRKGDALHFGMEFWSDAKATAEHPDDFERRFMIAYVDEIRRRARGGK